MKNSLVWFLLVLLLFISSTTSAQPKKQQNNSLPGLFSKCSHTQWVDSVFNSLTPDERIAQLIMVAAYSNRDQKHIDDVTCLINTYNLGGVIFFQGGPIRQVEMTNYFQSCAKTPLLIGIDGEWGLGMRLDSTISFPRQMMLGAMSSQNDSLIYQMGTEIADELKTMGIQLNFAPVVDINSNPNNPVINNRSFGENKYKVARKGILYMKGMQDHGVIATAKHFPGHGDTNTDSHLTLPVIKYPYSQLDTLELYPFRELIKNNVGGLMVAHLFVPAIDSTKNIATTLSRKVATDLIRDSLKYNGLVFTDALGMKGVSGYFQPGEIEVRALQAGNDVLLMPADIPLAISSIKTAIKKGKLLQSQIDSSCRRVLSAKYWAGLNHYKPADTTNLYARLNNPKAICLRRKITESAITLIKNDDVTIPLKRLDTLRMAVVLAGTKETNAFNETLKLYADFDTYYLPGGLDSLQIDSVIYSLRHYNLLIVSTHNTDYRPTRNFGIDQSTIKFLNLISLHKTVILNLLATPYALNYFEDPERFKSIIISYQDTPIAQEMSAQMIFGAKGAQGQLPVSTNLFPFNTRIFSPSGLRLQYAIPEELGIDSHDLAGIDSIVTDAIRQRAMPGCQVLAAKNGKVFYSKSFGYHTYDSIDPVKNTDLYDLASITKIAATTPAIMKLYEEDQIKLRNKLSTYLHELKKTNKKDVTIIDILTHQAQLQPYIPFYLSLLQPENPSEKLIAANFSEKYSLKLSASMYVNNKTLYKSNYISTEPDIEHGIHIADDMYLLNSYTDSIFTKINQSALLPVKQYKYSDLGFIYMYRLIENLTHTALNEYVKRNFYDRLGAGTLGYLPLDRFDPSQIVPTENDLVFRKQLVQGYVHDPTAAMLGGVSGHAGVFSDANDLAKLMQMYLNRGNYGGEKYFEPSTIDLFTSCQFCSTNNRRGLGFDKPEMKSKLGPTCQCVSASSFGHTGFTGTMTWADPKTGLLYVFLSNRVNPDAENNKLVEMNVRTRIQEVLAKCIEKATN